MTPRAFALIVALGLAALLERDARADLASDADELTRAWAATGKTTTRLSPLFLEHGRSRPVRLPSSAFGGAPDACTTVALLTGRSTDFVVRVDPILGPKNHASGGRVERSIAGAVLLSECGRARAALTRLALEARVARTAVEVVIAVGAGAASAIATALPERASGPVAPLLDVGPRAKLEPLSLRARQAEQRAKAAGASSINVQSFTADSDGTGRESLRIEEGCHRLELFSDLGGPRPVDLDAELRDAATERLVARDRSDASDVHLDVCAGTSLGVDLLYAGAPGAVRILLVDQTFPLPRGVPTLWGSRARAGLASALRRRRIPSTESDPVDQRLGVAGVTSFPITVEPSSCYVAAVATMRGEPRAVVLTARVDTRVAFDANAGLIDNAAVAFCSTSGERVKVEIEVRGNAVAWLFSLWEVGHRSFDEVQ